MRSFTDTNGREWQFELNVRVVKVVRDSTGILLTELFDNDCELLGRLSKDVVKLVDILWVICERQANEMDVGEIEFAESLGGDALGDAAMALARACADFFSSQDQREGLNEILTNLDKMARTMTAGVVSRIRSIDSEQLAKSFMDSALNSPELLAAIPGATR